MQKQLRTAALLFAITCGLLLLGTLVLGIVSSGLPTAESLLPWIA